MKNSRVPKGGYLARRENKIGAGNKTYGDQGSEKKVTSSGKSNSGLRISGSESRPTTPVNGKNIINNPTVLRPETKIQNLM